MTYTTTASKVWDKAERDALRVRLKAQLKAAIQQTPTDRGTCPEGWRELAAHGDGFQALVRWDAGEDAPFDSVGVDHLSVPGLAGVLLSILIAAGRDPDALSIEEEFAEYRRVISQMQQGLDELERCYA